jgi:hypothetical protein
VIAPEEAADDGLADSCAIALRRRGADVSQVNTSRDSLSAVLGQHLPAGGEPPLGVLSLLAADPAKSASSGLADTLALAQAVRGLDQAVQMWCVTRSAVTVGPADTTVDPMSVALWGLGRVIALEYPEIWGGLVDVPDGPDAPTSLLASLMTADWGEDQLAVRDNVVYARRVVRRRQPRGGPAPDLTGTALITGGTGPLGHHAARWAIGSGADHVVLVGRTGGGRAEHATALGVPVQSVTAMRSPR